MATFRIQWDVGRNYGVSPSPTISDPFAPAYILIGTGIDYKPNEGFSAYLSPMTAKITIVDNQLLSNAGDFGVEPGEHVRYEVGGFLKIQYKKDIMENVNFSTKADFFANYLKNFGNIDVNWETLIAMKINKFLSASLSRHLIYDDDVRIAVERERWNGRNRSSSSVQGSLHPWYSISVQSSRRTCNHFTQAYDGCLV